MKKLLALMLAMMLTLTCFTGCEKLMDSIGGGSEEDKVKSVVNGFFDAALSLELQTAANYTSDPAKLMANMPVKSAKEIPTMLAQQQPQFAPYASQISPLIDTVVTVLKQNVQFNIDSMTKEGDAYKVMVSVSYPDFTKLNQNALMQNPRILKFQTALAPYQNITGQPSPAQIQQMISTLVPMIQQELPALVAELNLPRATQQIPESMTVINVNGQWVIDASTMESAAPAMGNMMSSMPIMK